MKNLNELVKQDELVERLQAALKATELPAFQAVSKRDVKEMTLAFFDVVHDFLLEGRRLQFRKSGTFTLKARPARQYRNPANNEVFTSKETAYVAFAPSLQLKTALRDNNKLALALLKKDAADKKARKEAAAKKAKPAAKKAKK